MAFDGTFIHALAGELNALLQGGKIDKIHQPERGTVTIGVRTREGAYKLLLCANPSCARAHLLSTAQENPSSPPMFCMLMRKHLAGGKITLIDQDGFDRILRVHVESRDEMGFISEKVLICELMGKYSNIILVNADGKIADAVYHVDLTVSSVRCVLPGLIYTAPPSQGKQNPLGVTKDEVKKGLLKNDVPLFKQLTDGYTGISPLFAREAVFAACGRDDVTGAEASARELDETAYVFRKMIESIEGGVLSPCAAREKGSGRLIDFSALGIRQYGDMAEILSFDTASDAAEYFYSAKSAAQSLKQKSSDLTKFVNNNLERCQKKLRIENETLEKVKKRDRYKIYGDLITANIYRINQGDRVLECENFYSDGETVTIPLKTDLTPSKNAQRYYTKYTKEKTAGEETLRQKELNLKEIDYLESVKEAIELAESGAEIAMIREELTEQGYLKRRGARKGSPKKRLPEPMHFVSDDGFDIYIGKNNSQNDYVTLKLSRSTDLWFHTKSIHGSHAIVKTSDAMTVPEQTYIQAASLAAYYSKARLSESVPVDYTEVKNVKKPSGAKPGMVIYTDYNTLYVTPDACLAERLRAK